MAKALMVAAPYSGSGKTTFVAGFLYALRQQGYKVQSFKVGPDYIDPSYHTRITGRPCRNLDLFLMGEEAVRASFFLNSFDADISIIEGVMGLFDGIDYTSTNSSAYIARLLSVPILLIWPCRGLAYTIIPLLKGLLNVDINVKIKGIVLNYINSPYHYESMKKIIESETNLKVVGFLPNNKEYQIQERHLGLVPADERNDFVDCVAKVGKYLGKNFDWNTVHQLLDDVEEVDYRIVKELDFSSLRIAYAFDEAFNFYYHDALDLLKKWGVELIKTSPINDNTLPENIDGLIIGGGFPELYSELLKQNLNYITSLHNYIRNGMPVYAECGGYMYLAMTGIIPAEVCMADRLVALGYYEGVTIQDSIIAPAHTSIRGHQFHYSYVKQQTDNYPWALMIKKPNRGLTFQLDGYASKNIFASYLHIHWIGQPELAKNFLNCCLEWKRSYKIDAWT